MGLIKNIDYIIENGLFVLTKEYLLKNGSCCGNGCKNCPYYPKHKKGVREIKVVR
jgi:hypothetical protein